MRLLILTCVVALSGCVGLVIERVQVWETTPKQAAELAVAPGTFIVDVSYPEDYARGHIPNAVSIPKSQVWIHMDTLPWDKDAVILVYDTSGKRSHEAAMRMKDEGYNHVHEMIGGLEAWQEAGFPIVPDGERPGAGL